MNKTELINAVAEKAGTSKKDTEAVLNAFTSTIVDTVAGGDDVQLIGFGTFGIAERAAREGRKQIISGAVQEVQGI
ncbi:MAG: HU family DNA-binding protein [Lachnospiraceae bacterium]|nr:HU family DNA-binding protein [Lachnospiraceae bacterium]